MARIGDKPKGLEGIRRPIIDQEWYEMAAETIGSSYTTPEERLARLNEIWGEFLLATNEHFYPRQVAYMKIEMPNEALGKAIDTALQETTGFTLDQVIKFAKEMLENGKNEAQTAAADAE